MWYLIARNGVVPLFETPAESIFEFERECLYGDAFYAMTDRRRTTMGAKRGELVGTAKHSA